MIEKIKSKPYLRVKPLRSIFKIAYWKLRWKLTKKPIYLKLITNQKFLSPKCGSGALIFYQGVSEPKTYEFIKNTLKKGDVFYDIGAHLGEFSILASDLIGEKGEVHAFEPIPTIYQFLQKNLEINRIKNVQSHPLVVSNKTGKVEFEVFSEPSISRISQNTIQIKNQIIQKISVDSITLNQYVENNKFPNLVKIDVEGAELLVLKGMSNILSLKKDKAPVIILELLESNFKNFNYEPTDILKFLSHYGYDFFDLNNNKLEYSAIDFSLIENNLVAKKLF